MLKVKSFEELFQKNQRDTIHKVLSNQLNKKLLLNWKQNSSKECAKMFPVWSSGLTDVLIKIKD
jgi:hypothetical protein